MRTTKAGLRWNTRPAKDPLAVVKRSRYEAGEFEVVTIPSMKIIAQGFETEESAQHHADQFNSKGHPKNGIRSSQASA